MARYEADREDILSEAVALVERIELQVTGEADHVVIGFRRNDAGSFYFGASPVYQFNGLKELRRSYRDGFLYKAIQGHLVRMYRRRTETETALMSSDVSAADEMQFLEEMRARIKGLGQKLEDGQFQIVGQVPPGADIVARVIRWIKTLATPAFVARTPRVRV